MSEQESANNESNIIHQGFDGLQSIANDRAEIETTADSAIIRPLAKTDLWRKTYYEPILLADNAPFLYHLVQPTNHQRWSMETEFELIAESQFDQAGILLRVDANQHHWLKAGIEVVDGRPRLSCVVTNEYSDWSTQNWTMLDGKIRCKLRLHGCAESSFVVEAWMDGQWELIRIAHLDGINNTVTQLKAGVYAACPTDQKGDCKAVFHSLQIQWGSSFDHTAA